MTLPDTPAQPPLPTAPQGVHAPLKPSRTRTALTAAIGFLAGAAAVGATWAGVTLADSTPETFALTGEFTLTEYGPIDDAGGCSGQDGYDDISTGTSVTVYDAKGAIVATGDLGASDPTEDDYEMRVACVYDVTVDGVPAGPDFYQVEIGNRGKLKISAAEAKAGEFAGSLG